MGWIGPGVCGVDGTCVSGTMTFQNFFGSMLHDVYEEHSW